MKDKRSADDTNERPLSEPPPRINDTTVGRYRLAFEMASGGMASLYLAVAESTGGFGKVLALKRIHPHLAKERDFREMFLDEARVAALLHHPNVCGVLDYGEEDGLPFFTMEYLLGEPLSRVQRMHRRMLGEPAVERASFAARIIADAAYGLHAAHELRDPEGRAMELVHRDVSPQNLVVTYDGVTRVLDFGIARTRVQEHHTATGTIKGKFAYMAPEQLLGEDVDRRADVWALGVCLWETLAGTRLFKRKTEMETLLAVTQGTIDDLGSHVDPDLSAIVKRALSRELDARYATAEEMARDLERFIVKNQRLYGAAEVSARMHQLFPDGLERKRGIIADALARRPGPVVSRHLPTESTSMSVDDISIVVGDRDGIGAHGRWWMWAGLAAATLVAVVVSFYWRPFADADAARESSPTQSAERPLVPLQQHPPPSDEHDEGEAVAPAEVATDETEAAEPSELAQDDDPSAGRRRRPRGARAAADRPTDAPREAPASAAAAPAPAPAEPASDGRRRPFLVESLEGLPAAPARAADESSGERRRPLVVEDLNL